MVYHCPNLTKVHHDTLSAAAKKGESYHAWKCMSGDGTSHTNVGNEDFADEEDGFGFFQSKSTDPLLQAQVEREQLKPDHLYFDSNSYFHQMSDAKHLNEVKTVSTILRGSCNAGTTFYNKKGWYKGLFHMWLVRNVIVNLLSLHQLESEGYRITYDTVTDWIIHVPDGLLITHGTKLVLKRSRGVCAGFPYLDMADPDYKDTVAMLQTVRANMKGLTSREVKKAILDRKAQARVGTPTDADFIEMVVKGTLTNCPVTPVDIANDLFQPKTDLFLHALPFECTSKMCMTFLDQFLVYFHIKIMHYTI